MSKIHINSGWWLKVCNLRDCKLSTDNGLSLSYQNGHPSPSILLQVRMERRDNGINFFLDSDPTDRGSAKIQLILKDGGMRRITSALIASIAIKAMNPATPKRGIEAHRFIRRLYNNIDQKARDGGPDSILEGVGPEDLRILVEFIKACAAEYDKLMMIEVDLNLKKMKRSFNLLSKHMSESDMVSMWRESNS